MMSAGNMLTAMMGAFGIVFFLLLLILLILWAVLPFSVFGIKDLIREAIEEQKKTNELLQRLLKEKEEMRNENIEIRNERS